MDMPLGGHDVAVAIVDCVEPKRGWIANQVTYFGWHVSDVGEVDIRCTELDGAAGQYRLGASEVLVDPARVNDNWSTRAVAGHELVHHLLSKGPHPETGKMHVCSWAYNDPVPPNCYPNQAADRVLMSPAGPKEWDGDVQHFTLDHVPEYRVTEVDRQFIDWALSAP